MSFSNTNGANRFPPQASLLVSSIQKGRGECHYNDKIAVTGAIPFLPPKKYFLICNSCFWCASFCMTNDHNGSEAAIYSYCPVCNKMQIESIPIYGNGYKQT